MITICESRNYIDTFFIFRENGIEVKIEIKNKTFIASHILTKEEEKYINKLIPLKHERRNRTQNFKV